VFQSFIRSPVLAGVGLVVMWSSGFVGAELSHRADADPLTTLGWRFTILAALLVVVSVVRRAGLPSAASWRRHVLIGVLCQPIYLVSVFEGVAHGVPGGTAALIAALQPLLVATVAGPLLGEGANKVMVAGMVLGLVGVTVVVSGDLGVTGAPWWAFLLPTLGMLSLATGTVVERRIRPPEDMLQTITMQAVITAVAIDVAAAVTGNAVPPMQWSFWAAVGWLIVLSSLGGYVIYVHVSRTQGATVVSTLLYLTPPTTMLWVFLMFGTPVHLLGFVGLAISGVGVWLVLRGRRRPATVRRTEPVGASRR
jgi:drug/metabolite transporter (DMT)-like permease